jgi:hypothetical protein
MPSGEQSVFIRVHPWFNFPFWPVAPIDSNPKSTPAHPKSTIDLGLEPLIWVKNGLQTPLLPACRPSFRATMTRELWNAGQIQTNTGKQLNHGTLYLSDTGQAESSLAPIGGEGWGEGASQLESITQCCLMILSVAVNL